MLFSLVTCFPATATPTPPAGEWPSYGRDAGGMRYSPLAQINPSNVAGLHVAWTYHMKPAVPDASDAAVNADSDRRAAEGAGPLRRRRGRFSQSEATPLVVG